MCYRVVRAVVYAVIVGYKQYVVALSTQPLNQSLRDTSLKLLSVVPLARLIARTTIEVNSDLLILLVG